MEIDEDYIEAFIKGQLPAEEQQRAEARYAAEPTFKQAVDEMRLVWQVARLSHATHIAAQVTAARQRHAAAAPLPRSRRWYWVAAAAALLLVAIGLYWLQSGPRTDDLYAEAFKPPRYSGITAGPGVVPEAYQLYAGENYLEALPLFAAIPAGTLAGDSAHFYLAGCHMVLEHFDIAIRELRSLEGRNPETEDFGQDIRWYLALALLHEERVEEAKRYLRVLAELPKASHGVPAKKLLVKLE